MTTGSSGNQYRESAAGDGRPLDLPAGASKNERVRHRLDLVEKNGLLVIGRGSRTGAIVRVVGSVIISLIGLAVPVMGGEGFILVLGLLFFGFFGILGPVLTVKRHRQDYSLELTPEEFTLIRRVGGSQEFVHRVRWVDIIHVGTVSSTGRPEGMRVPSVVVVGASGGARRPTVRTFFSREIRGERVTLSQPLAVGRWELVDLLREARKRFAPQEQDGSTNAKAL